MSKRGQAFRRREFLRSVLGVTTSLAAGRFLWACESAQSPQSPAQIPRADGGNPLDIVGAFGRVQIDAGQWVIQSDGSPRHNTGIFPNENIPESLSPQDIVFRCSRMPTAFERTLPLELVWVPGQTADTSAYPQGLFAPSEGRFGYEFGVALNGIPFNPNGPWYQRNAALGWQFDVLKTETFVALGLDENHGHPKARGQYHYHGIPRGLVRELRKLGYQQQKLLIGFAADGFPIYYDASVDSSYRRKSGTRPSGGPPGRHDGAFAQDYEYVASSNENALDECNGRLGPTPEFPDGIYHYYVTRSFPQISRKLRGIPDRSFTEYGPSSACAPLPDALWAYGGLSQTEVSSLKRDDACELGAPPNGPPPGGPPPRPGASGRAPRSYADRCSNCHGAEGAGIEDYAKGRDFDAFARFVRGSQAERPMPAFPTDQLADGELRAIYDYLRTR